MSEGQPMLSIVIAAYNAAGTIGETLRSVFAEPADDVAFEVIVVDDGSADAAELRAVLANFPAVRLLAHAQNRGACAARNSGIAISRGAVVAILDADDVFVPGWLAIFKRIWERVPASANVCFSACRTPDGRYTARGYGYEGRLDLADFMRGRYAGEYLTMFRGDYVRAKPFVESLSYENLSHLTWLQDGPYYVVPDIMRVYHDRRPGSLSNTILRRERARSMMQGLEEELRRFSDLYRARAPEMLASKHLRLAVYARHAGDPRAWRHFRRGASLRAPIETLGGLIMMIAPFASAWLIRSSKAIGLVKRHG